MAVIIVGQDEKKIRRKIIQSDIEVFKSCDINQSKSSITNKELFIFFVISVELLLELEFSAILISKN